MTLYEQYVNQINYKIKITVQKLNMLFPQNKIYKNYLLYR